MTEDIAIVATNLTGPAKRFLLWVTGGKREAWVDCGECDECQNHGLITRTVIDAYATERGREVAAYLRQIGFQ